MYASITTLLRVHVYDQLYTCDARGYILIWRWSVRKTVSSRWTTLET
jgi:hypothetical protein